MKNNIVSEYAEALFALSKEEQAADRYYEEMTLINSLFEENPDYVSVLRSPNITKDEKLSLLDEAFAPYVCENVLSFVKLLCEKGRIEELSLCYEDYTTLYNHSKQLIIAEATTAAPLTEEEKEKLSVSLEKRYGVCVELVCHVDPSILGGMIIKTEDSVIDGSLKTKIREIKDVIRS